MVNCPYCRLQLPWPSQQQNVPISVPQKQTYKEDKIASPIERRSILRRILAALLPSLVLGFLFYFLVALSQGMQKIGEVSGGWFWVGLIVFGLMLVFLNSGEKIFARFLQYMAFEFWAAPIMAIWYTVASFGQATQSTKGAETVGAALGIGIGGTVLIILAVIIGGFGGLILFLIGNRISKKSNKGAAKE